MDDLDKFKLDYTWKELTEMGEAGRGKIQNQLGEFLDTPREKEAKALNSMIQEINVSRYGW